MLGEGAFGKVYLAIDKESGEKKAIKAIKKSVLVEFDLCKSKMIEMTELERDIMMTNKHLNLISLEASF